MNFLYVRVSTTDQTAAHQATQARQAGFELDDVICDEGVSGVSTKFAERVGGARLLDKVRRGDTVIVRWVDRLGRNYEDVTATIRSLMAKGVIVRTVINSMVFDGAATDPMTKAVRDALIGFMAASAEAQAEATREAQKAGIDHAKGEGAYKGRKPSFDRATLAIIIDGLARGEAPSRLAKQAGVERTVIYRVKADPAAAEAALVNWGM